MFSANDLFLTIFYPIERGFQWSAPSNIALVKYWGKRKTRFQRILHFTLRTANDTGFLAKKEKQNIFSFAFEGKPRRFQTENPEILERIEIYLPF
jgi:diphosphomevalonate decarboxylase